jgi:hypothetical protein
MSEDRPERSAAETTDDGRRRKAGTLRPRLAAALRAPFRWPRGEWPIPTVTSLLFLSLAIVAVVELLPKDISDVTLSVHARTEIVELELDPLRTYVWWLPAGSYSVLTGETGAGCEARNRFDLVCAAESPTAITIKNGGTVRLETAAARAAPRFTLYLTPRLDTPGASGGALDARAEPRPREPSSFEVRDEQNRLRLATRELVTYESGPVDLWRVPLIVKRVQIGGFLSESIATADTIGAVRQPIMTEGDVRIFARSLGLHDRYLILEERFDPADVVQIPADDDTEGLLLGLVSLAEVGDDGDGAEGFDLTLHSDLAEVYVRRLGAEHRIGVSMWSVVSNLPMWLALWVVLVSLIVVANYHAQRVAGIRGTPDDPSQS